jgi:hypothetical protein
MYNAPTARHGVPPPWRMSGLQPLYVAGFLFALREQKTTQFLVFDLARQLRQGRPPGALGFEQQIEHLLKRFLHGGEFSQRLKRAQAPGRKHLSARLPPEKLNRGQTEKHGECAPERERGNPYRDEGSEVGAQQKTHPDHRRVAQVHLAVPIVFESTEHSHRRQQRRQRRPGRGVLIDAEDENQRGNYQHSSANSEESAQNSGDQTDCRHN